MPDVIANILSRLASIEAQLPKKRTRGRNSKSKVAERYDRTPRTIDRWRTDPKTGFPPGRRGLNGRWEWTDEELDAFGASQDEETPAA
jgi:hypothetical protein